MNENEIKKIIEMQRKYFNTHDTLCVQQRKRALIRLRKTIIRNESKIQEALKNDLGKGSFETYMCETGMVLSEIRHMLKHLNRYAGEQRVHTPLSQFHARSFRKPSPYGLVLIMSPWNYPFLLSMGPLVDAVAAGNTVVLKPSAYAPHTGKVIASIVKACFLQEHVAVITGGRAENTCLLNQKFDYIFFTGSQSVGKEVMKKAAEHLTPVTLELGGKSPCIVEKSANLKLAAKRIVFGKFLNCGQTCVAPDYIYCNPGIKDELIKNIVEEIRKQYGENPLQNKNYGKIINEKHFERICGLIDARKVSAGGYSEPEKLRIAPTVMDHVTFEDPVMQQEIFGPILPVLTYDSLDQAIRKINQMSHPLALYLFTSRKSVCAKVMSQCSFGGGCINDTIIHLATSEMGFGGVGESGMGSYHGEEGFRTFSHYKSIVDKKTWIDLPIRYQPYKKWKEKMVRRFLH